MTTPPLRKIIHIDMDAFFASIEQRDNPQLRGKPIAVGGVGERGVVAAASYEARRFGVRSAMASVTARKLCPQLIFVKTRHDHYKEVSAQIMSIFYEYTDLVEPLSIDEAFLDVTHNKKGLPSATLIAREIKQRIKEATGLTASVGISVNKFLAKVASDYRKPDGVFVIPPKDVEEFLEELTIEKFYGIGKVTAQKMHQIGIFKGKDLKQRDEADLIRLFGKAGSYYYYIVRGIDPREVNPHRIRKSVGTERTFSQNLIDKVEIQKELESISIELIGRMERNGAIGRTLTFKLKFSDFEQITRSKTLLYNIQSLQQIYPLACELLQSVQLTKSIRLMGLTISNLATHEGPVQLTLEF